MRKNLLAKSSACRRGSPSYARAPDGSAPETASGRVRSFLSNRPARRESSPWNVRLNSLFTVAVGYEMVTFRRPPSELGLFTSW